MKKKLLLAGILLLTGCNQQENIQQSLFYDDSFSTDLNELFLFNNQEKVYEENSPFLLKTSLKNSEYKDFYVVTTDFAYQEKRIENIKILVLPFSLPDEEKPTSIANVGYDGKVYNLDSEVDLRSLTYKGYRISFLIKDYQTGIKASIKGKIDGEEYSSIFYIPAEDFIQDLNN